MIATVSIQPDGAVVAILDTDDVPASDEERDLAGLVADGMLDACARVAIETWLAVQDADQPV